MPRALFGVTIAMTAQAFLRDQMVELASRGWDVHLACSDDDGTDSFVRLQGLPGVTTHRLRMARQPRPLRDLRSLVDWWRLVGRLRPDVVVVSTPKAGLLGMVGSRIRGLPIRIYHIRGLRFEGLTGLLARISRSSERVSIACSTHVLVDSASLLTALRDDGLLAQGEGTVLGSGSSCGVDTDWFRPPTSEEKRSARLSLGLPLDAFVVGFVGRVSVDKGVRELVMAVQHLRESGEGIHLALVGPVEGADELRSTLQIVEAADWATATGLTPDPRTAYWAFDVFCLPSYREGFPISPLEAQACGLPVVTSDATGCVDSVDGGVTGVVVAVRDSDALAGALHALQLDDSKRELMSVAARTRVVRDFDRVLVRENVVNFIVGSLRRGTPVPSVPEKEIDNAG